ncbi:hypothetical protein EV179_006367 [Coemansia sp. RSA 487]|nr:hypothetical protein EV179_006367 [Coemansia sp. RSA 487]
MEIFGFKVMDLCRILNMSLAKACKAFKCSQQKLSLDHSQVQSMFMSGKLEEYMKENYNKIREYNMMDVKTLSELYFKTRHELKRLCDYPEIFGNDFGQFKEEVLELVDIKNEDGPFGIFVAPKCYCFYARDKKTGEERFIKARFKGINIDRDRIWDGRVDYNKLAANQVHDLYYGTELGRINVEFYRTCLKQDVSILHSNLTKTVMNKTEYLNIKQHFCLKVIKHNA